MRKIRLFESLEFVSILASVLMGACITSTDEFTPVWTYVVFGTMLAVSLFLMKYTDVLCERRRLERKIRRTRKEQNMINESNETDCKIYRYEDYKKKRKK